MVKPRLLDLFCKAGGCTKGYQDAGFYVVGVDIEPQPNYCGDEFYQADALTFPLDGFAVIHASPPCQAFTSMLANHRDRRAKHPDVVQPIRERLQATGQPYVIENVIGAPVQRCILLCGAMFGLKVYRHRLFESNILLFQPEHPRHTTRVARAGYHPTGDEYYPIYGHFSGGTQEFGQVMGIDWMKRREEVANAIPPAYTAYIGRQLYESARESVA